MSNQFIRGYSVCFGENLRPFVRDIAHQYNMYSVVGKEQYFGDLLQKHPMGDWNGRTILA